MKINLKGVTRIVLIFNKFVIKIPNFTYSWHHFLKGLVANINENHTWKYNSGKYERGKSYLLCPVRWASWGGWILIQGRANIKVTYENREEFDFSEHILEFEGDDTISNYGEYEGRLVKIDYGDLDIKTTPSWKKECVNLDLVD